VAAVSTATSPSGLSARVRRTVDLLERRGYAFPPSRLAQACLGGPIPPSEVLSSLDEAQLDLRHGLVVSAGNRERAGAISERQRVHPLVAQCYLGEASSFARTLAGLFPFVISVSIAGSLATGGFRESDDVDLNLVVEDGRRHLAYVALNVLGLAHALRHRGKPVDHLTARPLAPRVMTANLILERSACLPLARQDEDMAYELLSSQPVVGAAFLASVIEANPRLAEHFPQLADRPEAADPEIPARLPRWLFPRWLDRPARAVGLVGWRYMQWTRRHSPEALARVAFVRATMHPYALFDGL
jgi:hypothetical protein